MIFAGVDLAWSDKKPTACAFLKIESGTLALDSIAEVTSDAEIVDCLVGRLGENSSLIAIDAPLIVPNRDRQRLADKLCGKLFWQYEASALSVNRSKAWHLRGGVIAKRLEAAGLVHDPLIGSSEAGGRFFEVYPHPAMVVLGNLSRTLKYKGKHPRPVRLGAFVQYENLLAKFLDISAIRRSADELAGKKLKAYEDALDAIFCAVIAWYAWRNPSECALLGTIQDGYILTPVFEHMKLQVRSIDQLRRPPQNGPIWRGLPT